MSKEKIQKLEEKLEDARADGWAAYRASAAATATDVKALWPNEAGANTRACLRAACNLYAARDTFMKARKKLKEARDGE